MLTEMMKKRRMTSVNAFFAAVGAGDIDVNEIKEYILTEEQRHREALEAAQAQEAAKTRHVDTSSKDDILVLNARDLKGLDYRMAKCCNPVFGDDVFGFVTRESGIKIHRITCPNAARLLESFPYRIQKVRWADTPSSGSFQVALKITTDQESEALNKIMEVVNLFKASIRTFNVQENQRQGTYDILMKILISSNLELDKILSQIRAQKHVLKVNRV
jgi:GTP pyrophosphokinase